VKYIRLAGDEDGTARGAFIEYTDRAAVMNAIALSGQSLAGTPINVQPALNTIIKPAIAGVSCNSREVEEAMRTVNDAEALISAASNPEKNGEDGGRGSRSSRSKSKSKRSQSRRR